MLTIILIAKVYRETAFFPAWPRAPSSSPLDTLKSESESEVTQSCDSLRPHGLQPTTLLSPWGFPGKSTGVGCHFLLQRIVWTQGSNPGLPHCKQMLYCLGHQGSPNTLKGVLSGSSFAAEETEHH